MERRRRHRRALTSIAIALGLTFALVPTADAAVGRPAGAACSSGRKAAPGDVCIARGNPTATKVLAGVRAVVQKYPIRGVTFGVWTGGKEVVTGALGESLPGVPATRDVHFRTGNIAEGIMTTLLLQMVDGGHVSLDDRVAKWFPDFPEADAVTLGMLANSTSGYADYVTSVAFGKKFELDPFQQWTPNEILDIARSLPPVFAPGTSWAFSDTNFVLLGQILQKAAKQPYPKLVKARIFDRLGMRNTRYSMSSAIPTPTLHAYSNERGKYEEATYWSPSWAPLAATATTDLSDMGKWSRALGTGSLLSKRSHQLQVGDQNVGLGPLTEKFHYAMGAVVANDWIFTNPQVDGYTGVVAYLPAKKASITVSAAFGPTGDISVQYAGLVFNRIAAIISPANAPNINPCPRGC